MRIREAIAVGVAMSLGLGALAYAAGATDTDGDGLLDFQNGASIDAGELNTNFSALHERLTRYEDAIFISDLGDVGIGTTSPGAKLETGASGNSKYAFKFGNAVGTSFLTGYVDGDGEGGVAVGAGYSSVDGPDNGLIVQGKLGIGTTTPSAAAEIKVLNEGDLAFRMLSGPNAFLDFRPAFTSGRYQTVLDTVNGRDLVISTNVGNVGVGTNSPTYKLHVNGSVAGIGAYVNLSDGRFKTHIETLDSALETVQHLRGTSFEWIPTKGLDLPAGRQIGFIAQEVEGVLPEAVSVDSEGVRSVAYASVVPVLVEAIKDQQLQISALKEHIANQTALLEEQHQRMVRAELAISELRTTGR